MENNRDINGFIDPKERELMSFLTDKRKQRMCPICKKLIFPVSWTSQPIKVCPDCGNVIPADASQGFEEKKDSLGCACLDRDARRCFEKRYIGTTPENEESMRDAVCECPCHDERDE